LLETLLLGTISAGALFKISTPDELFSLEVSKTGGGDIETSDLQAYF
jgi:hypothetical protein